ncbi:flavin reductase [Elusimicrobiota bacterium]
MNISAFFKISYGLYIVSSRKAGKFNGQISNTVFMVTNEPLKLAICINKQNLTHEFIEESKVFTASILSGKAPMEFIGRFGFKSGRDINKFEGVSHKRGENGAPIVTDNSIGYIEANVINSFDVGTHTMFIGEITQADALSADEPMTYAYYHKVKGGKAPKTAPTYIKEETSAVLPDNAHKCSVCGYVYDPAKGDPKGKIDPGMSFDNLPPDWKCPVCGAGKEKFNKV